MYQLLGTISLVCPNKGFSSTEDLLNAISVFVVDAQLWEFFNTFVPMVFLQYIWGDGMFSNRKFYAKSLERLTFLMWRIAPDKNLLLIYLLVLFLAPISD